MSECIFCKIVKGQIPAQIVYEDDKVLAFNDINPVAPVHILIIPKSHVESALKLDDEDISIISDIHLAVKKIAKLKGLDNCRLITNSGEVAGQTVFHLHYHLIASKPLGALIP